MSICRSVALRFMACIVALTGLVCITVWADDTARPTTVDIVASGVGRDETDATKDALRNAVRQAIGAIVGIDTMIQNEEVVRDQILTYSDGFVEKYEPVGKPQTTLSGLTSVTIRARIVRDKLIQKARAASISLLEVDGKGMFAEAITKAEQKRSAQALITAEFKDVPQKLITAEVVGKPRYDDRAQRVIVTARLAVDSAAYDSFVGRLTKTLDGIGGPSFTTSSTEIGTRNDGPSGQERLSDIYFPESEFPAKYLYNISGWQDTNYTILAVCSRYNPKMTSSSWRLYVLDPAVLDAINAKLSCLSISIEVLDANKKIIDCRYIPLGKLGNQSRHYEGPVTFESAMGDACLSPQLLIAPFANGRIDASHFFKTVRLSVWGGCEATEQVEFELKPEELARIATIVCKVTPTSPPKEQQE
jgi:hypothetical protein